MFSGAMQVVLLLATVAAALATEPIVRVAVKTPTGIVIEPRARLEAGLPVRDEVCGL